MTHSDEFETPSPSQSDAVDAYPADATPVSMPQPPLSAQGFEREAEESFRMAATNNLEDLRGFYEAGSEACETFAHALRSSFEELATGIGQFNAKLMEFGRLNTQSNLEFVTNIAGIRSMHDAMDMQTGYLREQYDAASAQFRELQALTAEIAEKTVSPFQQQFVRYTQMTRSC